MNKKLKILLLSLIIMIIIVSIVGVFKFNIIPNIQKDQIITCFSENSDKFENIRNYIVNRYQFVHCVKGKGINGNVKIISTTFGKGGNASNNDIRIEDKEVLQDIEDIFYKYKCEYIESINEEIHFVFQDSKDHFQSIDYYIQDISKIKEWDITKLKENWCYRSIWMNMVENYD